MDHQMNLRVSETFGQYYVRLPLSKAAKIVHGNALKTDWASLSIAKVATSDQPIATQTNIFNESTDLFSASTNLTGSKNLLSLPSVAAFDFILGNPPFIGSKMMTDAQRTDLLGVFGKVDGAGVMDYVTAWYVKAAKLIQRTPTKVAFVSTNSIAQGEQVGILWNVLFNFYKIKIQFAHQTFKWSNEAKGNAAVYCVIIGFSCADGDSTEKTIFEYADVKAEPQAQIVKNINPYLTSGSDSFISKRTKPLCDVPEIVFGSMPNDGGNFLFTNDEKIEFIKQEPNAEAWIKPFIGAYEFLNNELRWCLWLVDVSPDELRKMPLVYKRIEAVKQLRLQSKRQATTKLAMFPYFFGENRQPQTNYILVPSTTSENRRYIPMGFFDKNYIANNSCLTIPNGDLYLFGQLTSQMHMAWVSYVCGRLKSDFRYSNTIVYNNYPFPKNVDEKTKKKVEGAAQTVLDVRQNYKNSSLADLYDALAMPPDLVKAHQTLDRAVDACYRVQAFTTGLQRIEFLFALYEQYTAPMFATKKKK